MLLPCPDCGTPAYGLRCPRCGRSHRPPSLSVYGAGPSHLPAPTLTFLASTSGTVGPGQPSSTLTLSGLVIPQGATALVVVNVNVLSGVNPNQGLDNCTLDGSGAPAPGNPLLGVVYGTRYSAELWTFFNVSARSNGSIVFSFIDDYDASLMAWTVTGVTASPNDQSKTASGSSASPDTGAAPVTAQDDELLFAIAATSGPSSDAAGTWSYGFTARDRVGHANGPTTSAAIRAVTARDAYAAGKSGVASGPWGAILLSLRAG